MGRHIAAALLAAFMWAAFIPEAAAHNDSSDEVIYGADRYMTSLRAAKRYIDIKGGQAETAIIASGANWPDALAAAGLAGKMGAPIILAPDKALHRNAVSLLKKAGVTKIIISGGPAAVKPAVYDQLSEDFDTTRVSGKDRYETAVEMARSTDRSPDKIFVVSGRSFHGAMVAGPFAFSGPHPIVLTQKDELPQAVKDYLTDMTPTVSEIVIVGSENIIGKNVKDAIEDITKKSSTRVSGRDEYDTSAAMARYGDTNVTFFATDTVAIASGSLPYDALSAAPELGHINSALLLIDPTKTAIASSVRKFMAATYSRSTVLLTYGGPAAVPKNLIHEARAALSG